MKHFMIKYSFKEGAQQDWHAAIAAFIANIENVPALKGKISYRCTKAREGADYYHFAAAADEQAIKALQSQAFFPEYTALTKRIAGGEVQVIPLEIVAETQFHT